MIIKTATILAVLAVCHAIPIEEALKPEKPAPLPENAPTRPEFHTVPVEAKTQLKQPAQTAVPKDDKAPGSKDESDLKTDNSLWWSSHSKYYYPVRSSYYYDTYDYDYEYIPRTYKTYSYYEPHTYSYWRSYW